MIFKLNCAFVAFLLLLVNGAHAALQLWPTDRQPDPDHVRLQSNPAGVNLGAVMMAIASASRPWLAKLINNQQDGKYNPNLQTIDNSHSPNGVVLENMDRTYSTAEDQLWPNVIAHGLVNAGYPRNPDGSLASLSVEEAFKAITNKTATVWDLQSMSLEQYKKEAFPAWMSVPHPIVYTTKNETTFTVPNRHLKAGYAYAYIGGTESTIWLLDPDGERTKDEGLWLVEDILPELYGRYTVSGGLT